MKFTKSEIYLIIYVILQIASAFLDLNDQYSSKLKSIIEKIARKTDDAEKK